MTQVPRERDFATNVNPLGPPAWVSRRVASAIDELTAYPRLWHAHEDGVLCDHWANSPDTMLVASGSSELIFQLPLLLGCLSGPWVCLDPTFWEYALLARTHDIEIHRFGLDCTGDAVHAPVDMEALGNLIKQVAPSAVFLCSPNNPTGHLIRRQEIEELAKRYPQVWIVVDQTYAYFLDEWRDERLPRDSSPANIVAFTSFSKFYCLPGLRVSAIGCSSPDVSGTLRERLGPVRLNGLAASILQPLMEDVEYQERTRGHFRKEWPIFLDRLVQTSGFLRPRQGSVVFRLFEVGPNIADYDSGQGDRGDHLASLLMRRHGIRVCTGSTYGLEHCVRLRVGVRESNTRLLRVLTDICKD